MTYSTFMGLETARRGLAAGSAGMDVTGHNVANANTPGYTRQRAVQQASFPYTVPSLARPEVPGQMGTGVLTMQIQRIRDNFLDGQIRAETSSLGAWQAQNDALTEIETIFMEPSDNGLNTLLADFWSSWQELSKNAESSPVRTMVAQSAVSLADGFNHTYSQMETVRTNLQELANISILDINDKANQIAALNNQIVNIIAVGDQPNDLLDRRDLLLDELAGLTNYKVTNNADGTINVDIGDFNLVNRTDYNSLDQVDWDAADPWGDPQYAGIANGNLKGIQDAMVKLQSYETDLDILADSIMAAVNDQHASGFDLNGDAGVNNFFTGSGAVGMSVNNVIVSDVNLVAAASAVGEPGDGSNALAIAGLQHQNIVAGTSGDGYYKNLIARLGVETQQSVRMVENQEALVGQLTNRKESISGVSLDEEMTNLIQYQYAYQSAARVITVLDEMLDTLINRMAV